MSRAETDWLIVATPFAAVALLLFVAVIWRPRPAVLVRLVDRYPAAPALALAAALLGYAIMLATDGQWWAAAGFLIVAAVTATKRFHSL